MGKGDRKTRRGKLFMGSFGVRRRRKQTVKPIPEAPKAVKEKEIKTVAPPESKAVAAAPQAKARKAPAAKKEPKAKKAVESAGKNE